MGAHEFGGGPTACAIKERIGGLRSIRRAARARRMLTCVVSGLLLLAGWGTSLAQEMAVQGGQITEVSSEQLVEEALRVNPDLEAARRRYEAASQAGDQVGALEDPQFMAAYAPKPTQTRAGPMDWRFSAQQRIPFWGVRGLREEAADERARAMGGLAEAVAFDLAQEVKIEFHAWVFARRALAINESNRQLLEQFRRIAEQRYRAGLAPQSDPLKAAVALARIDAQRASFERMKEYATGALNVLLDRPPHSPLGVPREPSFTALVLNEETLQALALERRPEIKTASAQVAAAEAQQSLAARDFFPNLMVGLEYAPMEKGTNPMYRKDGQDMLATTFGVNVPLQIGKRLAASAEADAREANARFELKGVQNQVLLQVHKRLASLREARRVLELYRSQIVPNAQLALDATRKAYENARVDFLNLLDSERSYEDILLQEAEASRNYLQETARLERTVGASLEEITGTATDSQGEKP